MGFGLLATPLYDTQAWFEEFVLAQAEDAANPDFISPTFQSPISQEKPDYEGPLPVAVLSSPANLSDTNPVFTPYIKLQAGAGHRTNRPLFLLYHNFRFGGCSTSNLG
ncbi:MAG: hypothetical protein KDC66_21500 [Phaeodactylibacter sp.]|nr:hypothetical protein [Phaeodactylibacter sp.]MCB9273591.1 hypothetical protein [Lewinellaceae bacterium]